MTRCRALDLKVIELIFPTLSPDEVQRAGWKHQKILVSGAYLPVPRDSAPHLSAGAKMHINIFRNH